MRPVYLATPHEMPALAALCSQVGMPLDPMPNVLFYCRDGDDILGVYGLSWRSGEAVLAPAFLAPGHEEKRWVSLRLLDAVERFLFLADVPTYIFHVQDDRPTVQAIVERLGARPTARANGGTWYVKETENGRHED